MPFNFGAPLYETFDAHEDNENENVNGNENGNENGNSSGCPVNHDQTFIDDNTFVCKKNSEESKLIEILTKPKNWIK